MNPLFEGVTDYFSGFLGVYLFFSVVFLASYLKTKEKQFRSFLFLGLSMSGYLFGALLFVHSGDPSFNSSFLFPLQAFFGSSAFFFYLRSIRERLYITTKGIRFFERCMAFIMLLAVMCLALHVFGIYSLFEEIGAGVGNAFMDKFSGPWSLKKEAKAVVIFFPLLVILGNLYLLRIFFKAKLSGLRALMTVGAVLSLISNLNDNLMGMGVLEWAVPSLPFAYILETFYFFAYSLGGNSKGDGLGTQRNLEQMAPNNASGLYTFQELFSFAAESALKQYDHLEISLETSLSDEKVGERKENGVLVFFYHLIKDICENVNRSPLRRATIELRDGSEKGTRVVIETSPGNYGNEKGPNPYLSDSAQTRKAAEIFGIGVRIAPGRTENQYIVRF